MYIARIKNPRGFNFFLRESRKKDAGFVFQDLFDLGPCPGQWVRYPGRNAFYLDEDMVDSVMDLAQNFDMDLLEDLFWPWVRPDIRRAVETFRNRSFSGRARLTDSEKEGLLKSTHAFDKRRAHYLKFGNMDQGPLENMPPALFKDLIHKSRDEIEQGFMAREAVLRAREVKSYVYAIFDIQSFFSGFLAKKMPQAMDQNKVEAHFLKELCRLNKDLFGLDSRLDTYMIRYLIMFFDHEYAHTTLLEEMERDFKFRHRSFSAPPKPSMQTQKACAIFEMDKSELKTLSKRGLTRRYRKLAGKAHPDRGGSHEDFIKLNNAFEALLAKLK
ncbi:J domain-containing protein [Desulfospira joergensenii]|uniref:J domain-containing protein n=1 Tax=Desulfospira joergensenii TaxID=53329 RepID=UPI0003B45622|nr:J domain-containing protein [Desulfospira joergensenii]